MATLKANGKTLATLTLERVSNLDGVDSVGHTEYRAMSSGKILRKFSTEMSIDGLSPSRHTSPWKVFGKIRPSLLSDKEKLAQSFREWAEEARKRGYTATVN